MVFSHAAILLFTMITFLNYIHHMSCFETDVTVFSFSVICNCHILFHHYWLWNMIYIWNKIMNTLASRKSTKTEMSSGNKSIDRRNKNSQCTIIAPLLWSMTQNPFLKVKSPQHRCWKLLVNCTRCHWLSVGVEVRDFAFHQCDSGWVVGSLFYSERL